MLADKRASSLTLRLVVLGLAMEAIWLLAMLKPLWLWDHFLLPKSELAQHFQAAWSSTARYSGAVAELFLFYVIAFWLSRGRGSRLADIAAFAFPLLFVATLVPTFPVTSGDIFHYIMEGRIFWVHGDNPLVAVPASYLDDPYLRLADWQNSSAPYGPLWALLTGIPSALPQDHASLVFLGYKLLSVAFYLGTAWLVWLIVSQVRPQERRAAVILYAWNPLVLLMVGVNGHNDTVMMFFAALAIYLAVKERWQWALAALALSASAKYVTVLLLPLFLFYGWQRRERRQALVVGALLAAVLAAAVFAPFWEGLDTFSGLRKDQRSWFITSTPEMLLFGLEQWFPRDTAMQLARTLGALAFLVPYLIILVRLRDRTQELMAASYLALFFYLLVGSPTFFPWYMIWIVTLGAALFYSPWALTAVVFSFTAAYVDVIEAITANLNFLHGDMTLGRIVTVIVVFPPPALLWLFFTVRGWSPGGLRRRWVPALVPE